MITNLQTMLLIGLSCNAIMYIDCNLQERLLLLVAFDISISLSDGFAPIDRQPTNWDNDGPVHMRTCASPNFTVLTYMSVVFSSSNITKNKGQVERCWWHVFYAAKWIKHYLYYI